jgi:diaminopimelate epimerase
MRLSFSKMHGLGNDFVLLDGIRTPVELEESVVARLGDRRLGVGFDQLLQAVKDPRAASGIGVRIYNTDGSKAEHCGNGMRCFARFLAAKGLVADDSFTVQGAGGVIGLELLAGSDVRVQMGVPSFQPANIPLLYPHEADSYVLEVAGHSVTMGAVAIGNPHAVIDVPSVVHAPVGSLGPQTQASGHFPQGVNVGFREVVCGSHIRLRVFERGAGETLACGSGACAAVVTGIVQGRLENDVLVDLPGGTLSVRWEGPDEQVWLVGPTAWAFEGEVDV